MEKRYYKEKLTHGTDDFPMAVYDLNYQQKRDTYFTLHYHDEFELLWVLEGAMILQMDGDEWTLCANDAVFINAGTLHMAMPTGETACHLLAIVFNAEWIAQKKERIYMQYIERLLHNSLTNTVWLNENTKQAMREILQLWIEQPFGYEMRTKGRLLEICAYIAEKAEIEVQIKRNQKTQIAKAVLDYIDAHFMDKMTLDDIAKEVHLSNEHLCRVFKEISGESLFTYLNHFRIAKSREMLEITDRSIAEIAQNCGFTSSSYFNRVFLKYVHCTPKDYRKRNRI